MPSGQLKKVGHPGQLGPDPQPLVGGEQPPKYLHRHAQIQVLTHPRGTGDIRFLKISSGPWAQQCRLQIIQSPWVPDTPRHTAHAGQHPPQQGAHGAALGTPHPVFHSPLFSPAAPSAEPHTRHRAHHCSLSRTVGAYPLHSWGLGLGHHLPIHPLTVLIGQFSLTVFLFLIHILLWLPCVLDFTPTAQQRPWGLSSPKSQGCAVTVHFGLVHPELV